MTDKIRIKLYVNTGYPIGSHSLYEEIEREDWEGMSSIEQEAYLDQAAVDFMQKHIEFGAYVVD